MLQLVASTGSGRAGAMGILQAILQAMLQGPGPVGYCLKVLKGIISAGCCARCLVGVCSWILAPGYCGYCFVCVLFLDPRSVPGIAGWWALLAPRHCGFVGVAGSWHCWLLGVAGPGSLGSLR